MSSSCPRCGSGSISVTETDTQVTHTCNRCGYSETQTKSKGKSERVGRAYALALLAMVTLGVVLTIWAGTPA